MVSEGGVVSRAGRLPIHSKLRFSPTRHFGRSGLLLPLRGSRKQFAQPLRYWSKPSMAHACGQILHRRWEEIAPFSSHRWFFILLARLPCDPILTGLNGRAPRMAAGATAEIRNYSTRFTDV